MGGSRKGRWRQICRRRAFPEGNAKIELFTVWLLRQEALSHSLVVYRVFTKQKGFAHSIAFLPVPPGCSRCCARSFIVPKRESSIDPVCRIEGENLPALARRDFVPERQFVPYQQRGSFPRTHKPLFTCYRFSCITPNLAYTSFGSAKAVVF